MPRLQGAREPINAKDQMQWPTDESRGKQGDPQKPGARSLTLPAQIYPSGSAQTILSGDQAPSNCAAPQLAHDTQAACQSRTISKFPASEIPKVIMLGSAARALSFGPPPRRPPR